MVNLFRTIIIGICIVLLASCSGADSNNLSTSGLSVVTQNANGDSDNEFTTDDTITIVATLRDALGAALANETITFSATSGTLSASSSLSNDNGQSVISLFLADATPGVITITISAVLDDETVTATANVNISLPDTELSTEEIKAALIAQNSEGTSIATTSVSNSVTILATITDSDDAALEGQIVRFSTTSGSLSSPSRLTDSSGIAQVILNFTNSDIGVVTVTADIEVDGETVISKNVNIDVTEQPVTPGETGNENTVIDFGALSDGIFDSKTLYADDSLLIDGVTTIGAGSSFGVSVTVYNATDGEPITNTPYEVSFTSTCVEADKATIDATVFSIQGTASATYQDLSCAGANGNEDNIVATVTVDSTQYVASRNIKLQPEALGSIEFVSASPESIVLKGVGGQGNQESAVLTFLVKGQLGNPQAQKEVNFELSTQVGGISLISNSGTTNANGLVNATVLSGSAPTAVRVTAIVTDNGTSISTQSDILSVNTGLPDQNSITLAFSVFNPEARDFAGEEVTVTAYLADSFNNPVPDGTTVNFTTEGGAIEPSCNTLSGKCSVTWNSQDPHATDHRVTVLATAVGHEYFVDVDGNNYYNDLDGTATDGNGQLSSGLFGISTQTSGFIDMSEAWRDDNENYQYDSGEQFIDDNNDGAFTVADGLFNGPQCNASSCSDRALITIRKAGYIITSGSTAHFSITNNENPSTDDVYYNDFGATTTTSIPADTNISVFISDSQNQILPAGTNIYISTVEMPDGTGTPTYTVANRVGTTSPNTFGGIRHNLNTATATALYILVTTPKSIVTSQTFTFNP